MDGLKKVLLIVAMTIVFLGIVVVLALPKENLDKELEGQVRMVGFAEVNVRETPSENSEVVTRYYRGYEVELTGKMVSYPLKDVNSLWYKTKDGWITSDALLEEEEYKFKFGYL